MSIRLAVLAVLVPGFLCMPAWGQVDEQEENLDNIIVTASRSPIDRVDVGSASTVITRSQIESRQARYVTDMLRSVPGFSVSQAGTMGSQTQVRVRGAEANHVLVMIDGVRANDPASGDEFRWELLSTGNVERIEIIRGPQSSLWGSDAVAAVVHVITRTGSRNPGISAYAEGGSNDARNGGLSGGTAGKKLSVAYALESLNTDGDNISRSGSEDDGSDMLTASLSGRYLATDRLTLNGGARLVDAYSQLDPVDNLITGLPADADVATEARQSFLHFGAALQSRGGRLLHQFNARYFDSSNDNLEDGLETSSTASDRLTFAYQADIGFGENLLSLAAEFESTDFKQRGEISFGDPNQDQDMSVGSVIADFQARSGENITWLASARYDDYSDFESALTGRLSLAYEVSETTRLRGNLGSGQKAPTFIERFGFFPGQFIGNPELRPEKSTSVDLGIEQSFADNMLTIQLTVFHQDLEDEINGFVFDPDTFLFTAENVDGDSTRSGVEFAGTIKPTENLLLAAAYTYTDSKEDDEQGGELHELRRPRHTGSISGNFRFHDQRASLMLVADYGGTSDDIFFPPFPAPSETVTLDAYWLLDFTAAFDVTANVNLFARVSNVLDEEYEQVYGYRNPGRSGYLGFRLSFGDQE